MLQSCLYIWHNIISLAWGEKIRALSNCPHDFLNPTLKAFFNIFLIFDILQQKLSMIAFIFACILALRLTVDTQLKSILVTYWLSGSKHFEDTAIQMFLFYIPFSLS